MGTSINVEPFETYMETDWDDLNQPSTITLSFFGTPFYTTPSGQFHEDDEDELIEVAKQELGRLLADRIHARLDMTGRFPHFSSYNYEEDK